MSGEKTKIVPGASPAGARLLFSAAILLVAVLAAYSNSFNAGFHLDDYHQIVQNRNVRDLSLLPDFFTKTGFGSAYEDVKGYRPVTHASFALSYAMSGYDVWGYHLINVALHFLNALLVFLITSAVLRDAGRDEVYGVPLFVALVFAVHPIQTGAVTYISGRAVLLASLFYLSAFMCFLRFRGGVKGGYVWAFLAPALYFLGLLSKEIAVSLIAAMAVYDLLFTFRRIEDKPGRLSIALYYIPFMAVLSAYFYLRRIGQTVEAAGGLPYGVWEYMLSEARVLLMYVRLLLLPVNQNNDYMLPLSSLSDVRVFASAALVAAAAVMLYRLRRRSPELTFFGVWFLIALAPESSIIPIVDIAVEYRLYLPSVGFIAVAAIYLAGALGRPAVVRSAAATAVVLFGLLTFVRNHVWADDYTLWTDVVKKSPYSGRALHNHGLELDKRGRHMEALEEFRRALEAGQTGVQPYKLYNDMGVCLLKLMDFEKAAQQFEASIAAQPGYRIAYENLARTYYAQGRTAEAEAVLKRAPSVNRENPMVR